MRKHFLVILDNDEIAGIKSKNSKNSKKSLLVEARSAIDFRGIASKTIRSLGFTCSTRFRPDRSLQNKRVHDALTGMQHIHALPSLKTLRADVIQTMITPKLTFGSGVALPSYSVALKLRTCILKAAYSCQRLTREPHIAMAICFKAHRLDSYSACVFSCIMCFTSCVLRCDLADLSRNLVEEQGDLETHGPTTALNECLRYLNWALKPGTWQVDRLNDTPISLLTKDRHKLAHDLRRLLRYWLSQRSSIRPKLLGVKDGHIDAFATAMLIRQTIPREVRHLCSDLFDMHGTALSSRIAGTVTSVVTGSVRAGKRLAAANVADSALCPLCKTIDEDYTHFVEQCPCFSDIRFTYSCSHALPDKACTTLCGILVEDEELATYRHKLAGTLSVAPMTRAFADGVCKHQSIETLRLAGVGVYFENCESMIGEPLWGEVQCSIRAEIAGVLLALLAACCPLCVVTDCAAVISSVRIIMACGCVPLSVAHADLWTQIFALLSSTCRGTEFQKVKSHRREAEASDKDDLLPICGNNKADSRAVDGCRKHQLPASCLQRMLGRCAALVKRQFSIAMMINRRMKLLCAKSHQQDDVDEQTEGDSALASASSHGAPTPSEPLHTVQLTTAADTRARLAQQPNWRYQPILFEAIHRYFHGRAWGCGSISLAS